MSRIFQDIDTAQDLSAISGKLDFDLMKVDRLTSLFSACVQRDCFRITSSDGRVLKARRFENRSQAERIRNLSQFLNPGYFPRVLASYKNWLVIEWIDGTPIDSLESDVDMFRQAGVIQAALHRVRLPYEFYSQKHSDIAFWQDVLIKRLNHLVQSKSISEAERKHLLGAAKINCFDTLPTGLTHGDFCAENIVLDEEDNLIVVDLETISVTALPYDLARTIYRWQMNSRERSGYFSSYSNPFEIDYVLSNFSFWIILVLSGSASFRAQGQLNRAQEPIRKLRETLDVETESELLKLYGI